MREKPEAARPLSSPPHFTHYGIRITQRPMPANRHARLAFLALIGGATGIGFAPIFVRLSETGPTATAFYRLLFALPLLWLWAAMDRPKTTQFRQPAGWRDFLQLALGGLFFTADLSIWHWSLQFTTVTNSTLLTNNTPLFVTIG